MAYASGARVRVTSQNSEHRNMLGTVETAAADAEHGFNEVRLDGHPIGRTVNLGDNELGTTNVASPIDYGE